MSSEKKTDVVKIIIFSVSALCLVLFSYILNFPRFQGIPSGLIVTGIVAFVIEAFVCFILKGRNAFIRAIKIIILTLVNASVFTCGIIYFYAPAVILQPHKDEASYSYIQDIDNIEEITFDSENGKIAGFIYNSEYKDAPVILYFYGNYETAATALSSAYNNYSGSVFEGYNVAVFDYPSYGNSEGKCTDDTLLSFSLDVFDEVKKHYSDVIVFGYSVGTGPATYLASERDVSSLILYAPYFNGTDLYNNVIDIFHGPLERLVAFNIQSGKYAENVTEPVLVVASSADRTIPVASSSALSEKFEASFFADAENIGHNDFFSSNYVKQLTVSFLEGGISE